jgi:hypothetical protein
VTCGFLTYSRGPHHQSNQQLRGPPRRNRRQARGLATDLLFRRGCMTVRFSGEAVDQVRRHYQHADGCLSAPVVAATAVVAVIVAVSPLGAVLLAS